VSAAHLRDLPAMTTLLESAAARELLRWHARTEVVAALRVALAHTRTQLLAVARGQTAEIPDASIDAICARAASWAANRRRAGLQPVINATGIVLHTNLGRAPLSSAARDALAAVAGGYSNLELELASGRRGHREDPVQRLLCELTGAQAATVVNNNAAAVYLALTALAQNRRVAVSRGELIEIGGSFRISEIMRLSGAQLVEVGTTNRTRVEDYQQALAGGCEVVFKVHASNFRMVGFTQAPSRKELVAVARRHDAIVIEDLGSGCLIDLRAQGVGDEPPVQASVQAGVDVVLFSGDKLLGGTQAGLIVGRADLLHSIASHQLVRALRPDKLTLAALQATLLAYRDPESARRDIPTLALLTVDPRDLQARARDWAQMIVAATRAADIAVRVCECASEVGGGALPTLSLPSFAVALRPRTGSCVRLSRALRTGDVPVVGRIVREEVMLDVRTVFAEQGSAFVAAVVAAVQRCAERDTSDAYDG